MSNLSSKWRTSTIVPVEIWKLTNLYHGQNQNYQETYDKLRTQSLYYPITVYKLTEEAWRKAYPSRPDYGVNDDGFIWAVCTGKVRIQFASEHNHATIDAMIFYSEDDCVNIDTWWTKCDPLNNKSCPPFIAMHNGKQHASAVYNEALAKQKSLGANKPGQTSHMGKPRIK